MLGGLPVAKLVNCHVVLELFAFLYCEAPSQVLALAFVHERNGVRHRCLPPSDHEMNFPGKEQTFGWKLMSLDDRQGHSDSSSDRMWRKASSDYASVHTHRLQHISRKSKAPTIQSNLHHVALCTLLTSNISVTQEIRRRICFRISYFPAPGVTV